MKRHLLIAFVFASMSVLASEYAPLSFRISDQQVNKEREQIATSSASSANISAHSYSFHSSMRSVAPMEMGSGWKGRAYAVGSTAPTISYHTPMIRRIGLDPGTGGSNGSDIEREEKVPVGDAICLLLLLLSAYFIKKLRLTTNDQRLKAGEPPALRQ